MNKVGKLGFTIVELLIVIVVIAVLAAVTVVAYNGIKQRADNTARIAAAKDWYKIWQTYLTQNGQYPTGTNNNHHCLGTGYATDFDGNADEDCYMSNNVKHPTATLHTALRTVASLPSYPVAKQTAATNTVAGISMRSHDHLDPSTPQEKQYYRMLHYWLTGNNQDCVLRPVAQAVTGGWTASSASFTANDGGLTRCVILLPDPTGV
ncbi:MAG TPA: prepilin-type N-terminal cleavage/methylation domain-containing protein [Candidatus Saccharimonadales bacterium]